MTDRTSSPTSAQQSPPASRTWSETTEKVFSDILEFVDRVFSLLGPLGKIVYPLEVYQEALKETFLEVWNKIDRYDPTKVQVLTWVNKLLYWKFLDVSDRHMKKLRQELSLDIPIVGSDTASFLGTLGSASVETYPPYDKIVEYLDKDPEGLLQQKHIKGHREANFRAISLKRIDGKSWNEISAEFGVNSSTLKRFYERTARYFASKFMEYLEQ